MCACTILHVIELKVEEWWDTAGSAVALGDVAEARSGSLVIF